MSHLPFLRVGWINVVHLGRAGDEYKPNATCALTGRSVNEDLIVVGRVEWENQTAIYPFGLTPVVICVFGMLIVAWRYAIWPLADISCLVAPVHRVVVVRLRKARKAVPAPVMLGEFSAPPRGAEVSE